MAADENAFRPDWCIAPSATLREWMEENVAGSLRVLVACCGPERREQAAALVQAVLDREPLTDECAEVLAYSTGISAAFWRNYEHNYRAGLAAGLKDCTDGR